MVNKNMVKDDDVLFEELAKNKKKKKKRLIITIVAVVVLAALILVLGIFFLRRKVNKEFLKSIGDVVSAEATVGSISTTVSGSGTLANVDEETITLPADVEVDEIKVSTNQKVKAGDVIATVDMPTVMTAMSTLQEEIDDLDKDLYDAVDDIVNSYIASGVSGRVKKIYAQKGDSVSKVMYDKGALALISLDGHMSVDIESGSLSSGDKLIVVRSDEKGTELEGTVDSVINGVAHVLVTDNGPEYGETVVVRNSDGKELGTGKLDINSCLRMTGITGTVTTVCVSENAKVNNGTTVFYLTGTAFSANYDTLLKERNKKEATLAELARIYTDGALTAVADGSISSILYDEETGTVAGAETEIATYSPDKKVKVSISVDESKILSLEIGQTAQVSISSIGDEYYDGEVSEINKTATSSSGVTRYSAVVTLDKTEQMLPGMTAKVAIRIKGVDNAVLIPIEALHQTSSMSYVYTSYDENTKEFGGLVEVEAGISNSNYAEIISGLRKGDTVYYTETENSAFGPMNFGGGMPGGGGMPDFGGERPNGGFSGGMPGGGGMPDFGGERPSGGFGGERPNGGFGGGMPGGK